MRLPVLLLLASISHIAVAQTLDEHLRHAALEADSATVAALVAGHRLEVKPVVHQLVREATKAAINGQTETASKTREAAAMIATAFEAAFGERSLTMITSRLGSWDADALRAKVQADSLLVAAVSIRTTDRPGAHDLFQAALTLYESIGDASGRAEVLGQIGYVTWYLDQENYVERNQVALEARRTADDRQLTGNTLSDLGLGARLIERDPESALIYYLESEQVRRAIGDSVALSKMLPHMGITYEALGNYAKAGDYFKMAGDLFWAVGDTASWIIQNTNAVGVQTDFLGQHAEAMGLLLAFEQDLNRIDDPRASALLYLQMGVVNRRLGDYEGAVENYREVLALSEANEYPDLLGRALNNIAVVYIFTRRSDRAIPFLQRALDALSEDDREGRVDVLLSLASAHFQQKNYETSAEYSRQASEFADDPVRRGKVIKMVADTKIRLGRPQDAVADYQELESIAEQLELPDMMQDALFGLGEAAERQGLAEEALAYYEEAVETLETARGLLRVEEDKAGDLAQTRYLYEDIVHFLTKQAVKDPTSDFGAKAFAFAERGKGRAFLDQMAEALAHVKEGVDPELQSDLADLADNMAYLRGELATANPAEERDRIAELKGLVRQMEGEYDRVEREMLERNPRFAAMQYPRPVDVATLQQSVLAPGEVLLQYALGDSSSTLWSISRESLALYQLPPRSEIEPQIEVLRFALQDPSVETIQAFSGPAQRLFETLIGPVRNAVLGADQLVIVADGALHYLPFEVLLTASGGSDFGSLPYLLRETSVSYVQSASVLRQLRDEPRIVPSRELLAVGDPAFGAGGESSLLRGRSLARLPFSGDEVRGIAALFDPSKTVLMTENEATQASVAQALGAGTYRFVHFATHGIVNDDRPDFSALALAGSGPDAMLQASEIFNLKVRADLVVLSACETGLGQLIKGEGVVGLTRAFMYAGAPSVAVSLWSVSDASTSLLMNHLYSGLVDTRGLAKSDALREAKLSLLEAPATAHPFHWAPFVLMGRAD